MAVEQNRVKARLKALFPKANLSQTRLDAIAAKLSQKPADEADDAAIDEILNAYNEDAAMTFEELARYDDKIRTLEAKAKGQGQGGNEGNSGGEGSNGNQQQQNNQQQGGSEEMPAWFKPFADKVTHLETQQKGQTLAQKADAFKAAAKAKGIPEAWIKRISVTEDFQQDAVLTELEADYTQFAKENKLANFGNDTPPAGNGKADGKVDKDIVAFATRQKESVKK